MLCQLFGEIATGYDRFGGSHAGLGIDPHPIEAGQVQQDGALLQRGGAPIMSAPTNANPHLPCAGEVDGLDDIVFGAAVQIRTGLALRLSLVPPRSTSRPLVGVIPAKNRPPRNALL